MVPDDEGRLECRLSHAVGGHRCAFHGDYAPWPDPPSERDLIQPYVGTDRVVYLISGLFADDHVRARMAHRDESCIMYLLPGHGNSVHKRFPCRENVRCLRQQWKRGFESRGLGLGVHG